MDDILADQIEYLLTSNISTHRQGRQIITLVGFLANGPLPETIDQQLIALSRLVVKQEMFDSLVQSLNSVTRNMISSTRPDASGSENKMSIDLSHLVEQIEAARQDIGTCETVGYATLIAWIVAQARERKIFKGRRRS